MRAAVYVVKELGTCAKDTLANIIAGKTRRFPEEEQPNVFIRLLASRDDGHRIIRKISCENECSHFMVYLALIVVVAQAYWQPGALIRRAVSSFLNLKNVV